MTSKWLQGFLRMKTEMRPLPHGWRSQPSVRENDTVGPLAKALRLSTSTNPKGTGVTATSIKVAGREIAGRKLAGRKIARRKTAALRTSSKTTGLRYWMLRVLEECEQVSADFRADPVHDLRVALRRCRSLADGLIAIDPDPDWKAMKKAGKRLFQRLGELRDVQIMIEWIDKLHPASTRVEAGDSPALPAVEQNLGNTENAATGEDHAESPTEFHTTEFRTEDENHPPRDPAAQVLVAILTRREAEQKREARAALEEFDRKQWRQWSRTLPQRVARARPGSAVFKHLALERWTASRDLHKHALRSRSKVAFHTLRIGIKRFRYIVENFLPEEHKAWSNDLKAVQDLLGEVHDLDVLWATALASQAFPDGESREAWHHQIGEERSSRIASYHKKMVGPGSLWSVWRAGLPQGKQIQVLATQRMKLWAKALDPDFAHSERVARLALELYDGLAARRLLGAATGAATSPAIGQAMSTANGLGARSSLLLAALLHDVGKSQGNKGHHKASLELIKAHSTPLGWTPQDMQRAAIVARFHCGALPTPSHKALRDLLPDEQKITIQLAAILRLANAFDSAHDGHIRRIQIENGKMEKGKTGYGQLGSDGFGNGKPGARPSRRADGFLRKPAAGMAKNEALVIAAEGYTPGTPTAQTIAAERHLLETVLRRPVLVTAMNAL
jgi:CHAD domain-containing protein